MKKILIVGAGFSGSVIARELAEEGYLVDVIDKRNHIGGNCYDYTNEYGIRVHKYGPHIFHTNNERVVEWLKRFTEWVDFKLHVKAQLKDGKYVTFPLKKSYYDSLTEDEILNTFFKPYTEKMWAIKFKDVDKGIINRIPKRNDESEDYFPKDKYQMLPKYGYTVLFENILDHKNINVKTCVEFDKSMETKYYHTFNSMPIDVYFDSCYGDLPYRSIKFKTVTLPAVKVLPCHTVNFTHTGPHTRMIEWKNYACHGENPHFTTLTYEEPCDYKDNNMERYYPVKDSNGVNRAIYEKYKNLVPENVTFIGRCGLYVYIDMHQAISSAFVCSKKFIEKHK